MIFSCKRHEVSNAVAAKVIALMRKKKEFIEYEEFFNSLQTLRNWESCYKNKKA